MPRLKSYRRKRMDKISSRRSSGKPKRVTFHATKKVVRKVPVSFRTKEGKQVTFIARQVRPKRVKVSFYSRKSKSVASRIRKKNP